MLSTLPQFFETAFGSLEMLGVGDAPITLGPIEDDGPGVARAPIMSCTRVAVLRRPESRARAQS